MDERNPLDDGKCDSRGWRRRYRHLEVRSQRAEGRKQILLLTLANCLLSIFSIRLLSAFCVFHIVFSGESQTASSGHSAQRGLRAWQIFLPNQITWWPKDIHRSLRHQSHEILLDLFRRLLAARGSGGGQCGRRAYPPPRRWGGRRPSPAPRWRSCAPRRAGSAFPPCCGEPGRQSPPPASSPSPVMFLDLLRKKPVERISSSKAACGRAAKSCGVGYFRNSSGVTLFTLSSVHWAERIVATSNWKAFSCRRAHCAWGKR